MTVGKAGFLLEEVRIQNSTRRGYEWKGECRWVEVMNAVETGLGHG
jgi:hypothetical protein